MTELSEHQKKQKTALINRALGLFLGIFGLIVIVAVPFSDNFVDKMTNLVAGLIVFGIGAVMAWVAHRNLRSLKETNPDNT